MARLGDFNAAAPFTEFADITKHDTNNIQYATVDRPCDAIWVGGAGIVAAVDQRGSVNNFTCAAGSLLPIAAKRVNSTNTTATLMVALWF